MECPKPAADLISRAGDLSWRLPSVKRAEMGHSRRYDWPGGYHDPGPDRWRRKKQAVGLPPTACCSAGPYFSYLTGTTAGGVGTFGGPCSEPRLPLLSRPKKLFSGDPTVKTEV